jgi:hypothetical protein
MHAALPAPGIADTCSAGSRRQITERLRRTVGVAGGAYESLTGSGFRAGGPGYPVCYERDDERGGESVIALILLALVAIVLFGVGFTVHWLFIIAAVAALLWLIAVFTGGTGGRSRGYWY